MSQSLSAIYVHLVFSTKHRSPHLQDPQLMRKMHAYLAGASTQMGWPNLIVGGMPDHVHLLSRLSSVLSLSDWIKGLKQSSSRWVKTQDQSLKGFSWQGGYGAFSVSSSALDDVIRYISNQEEHHKKYTFQDEFRKLLERHNIEWDEAYVWD